MKKTIPFQNELLYKYIMLFGTFFDKIVIWRGENEEQKFVVPIEFAPREKFEAIVKAKPDDQVRAIQLPRISYELNSVSFDSTRKIQRNSIIQVGNKSALRGAPYNINFQLNIMTKNTKDMYKIVEQIIFMFQPDFVVDVQLLKDFEHFDRIATDLGSIDIMERYEGDFITMRTTIWTLQFTMHGWFYGPVSTGNQIKRIDLSIHPQIGITDGSDYHLEEMIIPGLTVDGEPTTDINKTIPYQEINDTDNYGFIKIRKG